MLKRTASFFLIKENEVPQVKYFLLLFVLIGTGLALGRGTTDALFFKRYGIEYLPVMYLVLSVALCLFSVIYATVADRFPAEKIFRYLFITLSGMLIVNWALMSFTELDVVYPIYFLIYEIASEIFIIHAAHYLSQNFLLIQSKRLAPLIMAGTQVGIIIGGIFLANISHFIGIQNILLIWCLVMTMSTLLLHRWHKIYGASHFFRPSPKSANKFKQAVTDVAQGVRLMKSSKLLKALSFALFFMVITFYIMIYAVNVIYTETFTTEETLSSFFGVLTAVNGTLALLLQIFITNRAIRHFGAKKVKLWFPVASVVSYVGLFVSFTFPFALLASFSKDVIMNAFRNPVRGIIFNAIPENIRGRARATALFIVMPLALSICGALLWLMQTMDEPKYFVGLGLVAALGYLLYAIRVNKAYVDEIIVCLKRSLMMPNQEEVSDQEATGRETELILKYLNQNQEGANNEFSKMLVSVFPNEAPEILLKQLGEGNNAKTDKLIKILTPLDPPGLKNQLWPIMEKADNHLFSTILDAVVEPNNRRVEAALERALNSKNPRIRATGIKGVIVNEYAELAGQAINQWKMMLASHQLADQLSALELLQYVHNVPYEADQLIADYRQIVLKLFEHKNARVIYRLLEALQQWPAQSFNEISPQLKELFDMGDIGLRLQCINCCYLLSRAEYQVLTTKALNDPNSRVREAAVGLIFEREDNSIELLTGWLTNQSMGSYRAQRSMVDVLYENNAPAGAMAKVVMWKTNQLEEAQKALNFMSQQDRLDSALQVLRYTLAEKRDQLLDIVLSALRSIESPDIISVVRSGIHSKDSRYIAQACEVLHDMKNKHVANVLGDILENMDRKRKHKNLETTIEFTGLSDVLAWCRKQSDPWLKDCATQISEAQIIKESAVTA